MTIFKVYLTVDSIEYCMHSSKNKVRAQEEFDLYVTKFGKEAVRFEEDFQ